MTIRRIVNMQELFHNGGSSALIRLRRCPCIQPLLRSTECWLTAVSIAPPRDKINYRQKSHLAEQNPSQPRHQNLLDGRTLFTHGLLHRG